MDEGMTLLLVEDAPFVRVMVEAALEEAGHRPLVAEDGWAAMREIEDAPARLDGLVTDVRLGEGPDGWAVARAARGARPDLPVIYMTGDSAHEWAERGVPASVLLRKPFTLRAVTAALGEAAALAGRGAGAAKGTGAGAKPGG